MGETEFAKRLERAILSKHATLEEAGRSLQATVKGASYSNLTRILRGDAARLPSLEFVLGVAEGLGVRPAWLAFGDGAMTQADEAARQAATRHHSEFDEAYKAVTEGILEGLGIPVDADADHPEIEQAWKWNTDWRDQARAHWEVGLPISALLGIYLEDICKGGARGLGEMVRAELDAIYQHPLEFTPEELDDYLVVRFGVLLACSTPRTLQRAAVVETHTATAKARSVRHPGTLPEGEPTFRAGADERALKGQETSGG